jgi:hypothetical protein
VQKVAKEDVLNYNSCFAVCELCVIISKEKKKEKKEVNAVNSGQLVPCSTLGPFTGLKLNI